MEHPTVHDSAARGFQIAGDAYERGRGEYPLDAIERIADTLGLASGRTVVDVGAGTGKFTKLLVPSGARVIAVEPVEGMRRKFKDLHPGIEIIDGAAERLPMPDASADAVTVATAFHWFDGRKALAEFRRVLKPGGTLGLVWNAWGRSGNWGDEISAILNRYNAGTPLYKSGAWKSAFTDAQGFTALETAQWPHVHRCSPETLVERVASISFIAALPEATRREVLSEVEDLLARHPETAGKQELEVPYRVDFFWCTRQD